MAKEISRSFDAAHAAVRVQLEDALGNRSHHTFYLLPPGTCPACGKPDAPETPLDFEAALALRKTEIDTRADALHQALTKAGWTR